MGCVWRVVFEGEGVCVVWVCMVVVVVGVVCVWWVVHVVHVVCVVYVVVVYRVVSLGRTLPRGVAGACGAAVTTGACGAGVVGVYVWCVGGGWWWWGGCYGWGQGGAGCWVRARYVPI